MTTRKKMHKLTAFLTRLVKSYRRSLTSNQWYAPCTFQGLLELMH